MTNDLAFDSNGIPGGIWPILYAYFDTSNTLDRQAMRKQVESVVRAGAPGIAILGLATEVHRLSEREKRNVIECAASDIAGRAPLAVTLTGDTIEQYVNLAAFACEQGATSFILQPPVAHGKPESFYLDFFIEAMRRIDAPCGIQNAPDYLGVGLSPEALAILARTCPNFVWLKCEGSASSVGETINALRARDICMPVFNGRGGQELIDNLRAGCAGMIVAPDTYDKQVQIFRLFRDHREREAATAYLDLLPVISFVMQSLDHLTCYGKRIAAWRMGMQVEHDRGPAPDAVGLSRARHHAGGLGRYDTTRLP